MPDIPLLNIDPFGVQKLLEDLDVHKAPAPDSIPPRLLKDTASPLLTFIFQQGSVRKKPISFQFTKKDPETTQGITDQSP